MSCKDTEPNQISAGPWGGQYGCRWDDGVYCTVKQVVIASSAVIDSIRFEYENKGLSVWSERHGGGGGFKLDTIKLDHPNEYLVSISGHCGSFSVLDSVVVRSLSFESNRKKYGPFGIQQGTSFSLPISGGKLVGFHGRSGWHLDSIGVHVKPLLQRSPVATPAASVNYGNSEGLNKRKVVTYGPWGGSGGMTFDDGIYTGVREIIFTRSGGLVAIRVCYDLNSRAVWGVKNGRSGGLNKEKIVFDYPFELLTHITGYYASTILRGPSIIKSITFHTNKMSYGPFGEPQGIPFSSGSKDGVIVGFHGRKGYYIDSIGVHVQEGKPSLPASPSNTIGLKTPEVVPMSVPRESGPQRQRPWGSDGGKPREPGPQEPGPWGRDGGKPRETGPQGPGPWGRDGEMPRETGQLVPGTWGSDGGKPRETGPQGPGTWSSDGGKLRETGPQGRRPWGSDGVNPRETGPRGAGPWGRDGGKPRETGPQEPRPWGRDGGKPKENGPGPWGPEGGKPRENGPQLPAPWGGNGGKPRETGPQGSWGGDGGKPWDDGASYTGIRKIILTRGEAICSIQVEYDRNGESVWSAQHGHANNALTYIITFDHPHEMLTGISGYYGLISGHGGTSRVVRSLTFYTNVTKYGPYGEEMGNPFSSGQTKGRVLGFYGRSGVYLDAIGVHMMQQQRTGNESSYQMVAETESIRAVLTKILV